MQVNFSAKEKVIITMYDYINESIYSLPDDIRGTTKIPARSYLFKVDETSNTNKLDTGTVDLLFHHYTVQLLFLSKCTSPDIQAAVTFLCTRVQEPNTNDCKKFACVMKYLQMYPHLPFILGSDGKWNIYWSIDAAFAVHNNM